MGYIIAFIAGTMAGVTLMCIVSVTPKGPQEDEEQEKYLKEWKERHRKLCPECRDGNRKAGSNE